ncbi:MAG: hypothetical protein SFT91_05200 [Rickettsiaceae bacterium]|nr:hypothetical protein [Rickettsiaceae bacterium]
MSLDQEKEGSAPEVNNNTHEGSESPKNHHKNNSEILDDHKDNPKAHHKNDHKKEKGERAENLDDNAKKEQEKKEKGDKREQNNARKARLLNIISRMNAAQSEQELRELMAEAESLMSILPPALRASLETKIQQVEIKEKIEDSNQLKEKQEKLEKEGKKETEEPQENKDLEVAIENNINDTGNDELAQDFKALEEAIEKLDPNQVAKMIIEEEEKLATDFNNTINSLEDRAKTAEEKHEIVDKFAEEHKISFACKENLDQKIENQESNKKEKEIEGEKSQEEEANKNFNEDKSNEKAEKSAEEHQKELEEKLQIINAKMSGKRLDPNAKKKLQALGLSSQTQDDDHDAHVLRHQESLVAQSVSDITSEYREPSNEKKPTLMQTPSNVNTGRAMGK